MQPNTISLPSETTNHSPQFDPEQHQPVLMNEAARDMNRLNFQGFPFAGYHVNRDANRPCQQPARCTCRHFFGSLSMGYSRAKPGHLSGSNIWPSSDDD